MFVVLRTELLTEINIRISNVQGAFLCAHVIFLVRIGRISGIKSASNYVPIIPHITPALSKVKNMRVCVDEYACLYFFMRVF